MSAVPSYDVIRGCSTLSHKICNFTLEVARPPPGGPALKQFVIYIAAAPIQIEAIVAIFWFLFMALRTRGYIVTYGLFPGPVTIPVYISAREIQLQVFLQIIIYISLYLITKLFFIFNHFNEIL